MFRQKKYICGNYLYVEIFPRPRGIQPLKRARREKDTIPAQKKLNDRNSIKFLQRLVHCNFTPGDLTVDLSFDEEHLPKDRKAAIREVKNFIARLRSRRRKDNLPALKYVYVVSAWDSDGNDARLHIHMIMNKMDRDVVERIWGKGRCNTQRLQFDDAIGVADKVAYIAGQVKGHKVRTWACSQNLVRPEAIVSDKAVTTSMTERMARAPEDRAYFEKLYPGWVFTECEVEENFITGRTISISMRRYGGGSRAKASDPEAV